MIERLSKEDPQVEHPAQPPVLTLDGVSLMLSRDPRTVTMTLIPEHGLPHARIGRRPYFWKPAVQAWLTQQPYPDAAVHDPWRERETLSVAETADLLELTPLTVRQHVRDEIINSTRIGRNYLIFWPQLRDHIAGITA
ncbi:helix-turn-helix domain-containing protein [Dermatophilus congolensis]|uniref:hypothetical protein n=1 Tax=Dermatophilus congolensis TaxID=1863 RepID=UPI001AAE9D45|nr:hypothetical protein [Dermatophilus congolensis]MBO3146368.1 helix-turn-helix domain-containing protein [Dermatophilus congolensis]MBO3148589.1 helix-turn-helix domain-containing protein [Dermatophilus congolensis]MBO3157560.1 helix-turn-helix domain-containing protein [Dermatophilus congolensis]MBO3159897.1 helix-turn-helix domain-containing protein [Dermatophilus congolensis]MBO3166636.1 helix-turn-helix domain-containing protein [Dermatophilus congolensis]